MFILGFATHEEHVVNSSPVIKPPPAFNSNSLDIYAQIEYFLPENRGSEEMRFKPGQSGNPGGRPRELEGIRELARENAPLAIQTLVDVATNGRSEAARVSAAAHILDRAVGKPTPAVAGDLLDGRDVAQLTDEELLAITRRGAAILDELDEATDEAA